VNSTHTLTERDNLIAFQQLNYSYVVYIANINLIEQKSKSQSKKKKKKKKS